MDNINLAVIRETFGKVVYTHKTYEKAAEISIKSSTWIKLVNVILLVLTSGSAIGSIVKGEAYLICTSILATLALFFVVWQLSLNLDMLATQYKYSAKRLWLIREQYQNLIADVINNRFTSAEIAQRRDELLLKLNEVLQDSPPTNNTAYTKARKALKIYEEMTFSDQEIDNFLPDNLRTHK